MRTLLKARLFHPPSESFWRTWIAGGIGVGGHTLSRDNYLSPNPQRLLRLASVGVMY